MTIEDKSIIKSLFMDNGTVLGLFEYNDNIYALISEECVINNYQKVNIYKVNYINNEYIINDIDDKDFKILEKIITKMYKEKA